jgi:hypothetical protein
MWAAIAGSIALLVVLLLLGWDDGAWSAAAGVLLLSCVLVCVFAALQGRTAAREVSRAVEQLAMQRAADDERRLPTARSRGGTRRKTEEVS